MEDRWDLRDHLVEIINQFVNKLYELDKTNDYNNQNCGKIAICTYELKEIKKRLESTYHFFEEDYKLVHHQVLLLCDEIISRRRMFKADCNNYNEARKELLTIYNQVKDIKSEDSRFANLLYHLNYLIRSGIVFETDYMNEEIKKVKQEIAELEEYSIKHSL